MKIAITGVEGFIGSWLKKELEENGHQVFGLDISGPNSIDLLGENNFKNWIEDIKPDVCYHLAAQVGRLFGERDVVHTVRQNSEVTTIVAKWCGELGIRLAYVSSSEIYGDQGQNVCQEDGELKLPHNLYGLSKRWGEEASQLFAPKNLVIARLSMPYGPGVPPGMGRRAMDTMLWQAQNNLPINVHIDSERSWCWVGDTVRGLRMIIENEEGGIYNIGRDDDYRTMQEIAERSCDLSGASRSLINMIPAPSKQTVVKKLSTDKIRKLGWKPTVELEEGILKVYEWVKKFDSNLNFNEDIDSSSILQQKETIY
jgi:nucleoside-diphosphate-sugar epimerase